MCSLSLTCHYTSNRYYSRRRFGPASEDGTLGSGRRDVLCAHAVHHLLRRGRVQTIHFELDRRFSAQHLVWYVYNRALNVLWPPFCRALARTSRHAVDRVHSVDACSWLVLDGRVLQELQGTSDTCHWRQRRGACVWWRRDWNDDSKCRRERYSARSLLQHWRVPLLHARHVPCPAINEPRTAG